VRLGVDWASDRRAALGLLERESDLRVLGASLARSRDGNGTLLLIEGVAGVGKTALLT
jgi:predicted ATPase